MNTIRLSPNVPVTLAVRYADIMRGDHCPRLRLKGAADRVFVDAEPGLAELLRIGAIDEVPHYDATTIPEKGIEVPLKIKLLTIVDERIGGARHGMLRISEAEKAVSSIRANASVTARADSSAIAADDAFAAYKAATVFALGEIRELYSSAGLQLDSVDIREIAGRLFVVGEHR